MKIFILGLLLLSFKSWSVNLVGYRFSDSYRYSILEDSLLEKFSGDYVLTTSYGYVKSPFYYTDDSFNKLEDIISYNNVLTLGATKYFSDDLSLAFNTGAVNNKVLDETFSTFTDSNFRLNWNFFEGFLNSSLAAKVFVPTGDKTNYSGANGPGFSASLINEKKWGPFNALLSVGYQYFDNQFVEDLDYREILLTQLGLSYDLSDSFTLNFETYRNFLFKNNVSNNEGDYFLTLKHKSSQNVSTFVGVGVAGFDRPERNNVTAFLGVKINFDQKDPAVINVVLPQSFHFENRDAEKILGKLLESENIYFENNATEPEDQESLKINQVIKTYAENKHRLSQIVIEGYASRKGNPRYNLNLSQKRAEIIKNKLMKLGIAESLLSIVGYGASSEESMDEAKNRKVQFRIYLKEGTL